MGPITAISQAVARSFTFSGRASRSEYWWFFLVYTLIMVAAGFTDAMMLSTLVAEEGEQAILNLGVFDLASPYAWLFTLPTFLSVTIRRLHDAGFSGFWLILCFIPVAGLALIVMHLLPSENVTTAYGTPAAAPPPSAKGKATPVDVHKRAMQGYAVLFEKDKVASPAELAARKAEVSDYYRSQVLKAPKPV